MLDEKDVSGSYLNNCFFIINCGRQELIRLIHSFGYILHKMKLTIKFF